MRAPILLAAALFASLLTTTNTASAQAGAFRLGTDVSVLTVQHYPNPDLFVLPDPTVIFGVYNSVAGLDTALLFAPQFAYAITDQIVVGGHIGFAAASFLGSDVGFGVHVVPFLEYLFMDSDIRPFVGAELGPRIIVVPNDDAELTFLWGALGGVHIFTGDDFSVSPFVRFDVTYFTGTDRAGYEVVLGVSLEGWIGGNRQAAAEPVPEPTPEPTPVYTEPAAAEPVDVPGIGTGDPGGEGTADEDTNNNDDLTY